MTKIIKDLQNFGFTVTLIRTLLSNLLAFNFDLALAETAESACYSAFPGQRSAYDSSQFISNVNFGPKKYRIN